MPTKPPLKGILKNNPSMPPAAYGPNGPSYYCSQLNLATDVAPFDTVPPCDSCMERARVEGAYAGITCANPECAMSRSATNTATATTSVSSNNSGSLNRRTMQQNGARGRRGSTRSLNRYLPHHNQPLKLLPGGVATAVNNGGNSFVFQHQEDQDDGGFASVFRGGSRDSLVSNSVSINPEKEVLENVESSV